MIKSICNKSFEQITYYSETIKAIDIAFSECQNRFMYIFTFLFIQCGNLNKTLISNALALDLDLNVTLNHRL